MQPNQPTAVYLIALAAAAFANASARAESGLNGTLYWMDATAIAWSDAQWKQQADSMQAAGLMHIILSGPHQSILADPPDAPLLACDRLFAAARGTPLRIYLSLASRGDWYARWNLDEELDANRQVISRLAARYARHPSFAGWYIPHEIYVVWDKQARYITGLYAGLSRLCKQATPNARVIVSPFFILDRQGYLGDFRFAEPAEYESFWYALLGETQIDIVALQDSGEHLSCYTMDERRPFLAAMKRACARARRTLWINIETGELNIAGLDAYGQAFGRKTHVNDPKTQAHWRAVPADKLRAKLELAHEFTPTTITWGYQQYWDPMRTPAARSVYDSYQAPQTQPTP